jgi:NADPH:quinone reductase-like Zn-dependent oxidoreductase
MKAAVTEAFGGIDRVVVRPVVSEVLSLEAVREAHLRMQSGHSRGKIVVRP